MADIIVVGAGAAGLMSAWSAAAAGASVIVLERNEKAGKKIYITGKGRCNLTNDCTLDEFMQQVPRNPRFLWSALSCFSPQDMMRLMEENGCPVTVQRGRRVFPQTEKASDVTRTLTRLCEKAGVRFHYNIRVSGLKLDENGMINGVQLEDGGKIDAKAVIVCTGGRSYPMTGSTGDGWRMAEETGHTTLPGHGVLVGVETKETWPQSLQGLSLRNVTLSLTSGKKTLYRELGEMLFTHFGISGPLVLEMSCHLPEKEVPLSLTIDLKPGMNREQLDARLQREFAEQNRKQLKHLLAALLPASLAEIFPDICGIDGCKTADQITRAERETLCQMLQALPLTISRPRGVAEAIVTRGGVSVRDVNPGTMESKKVPGLYFAGELLDVDAHTGGYNLQIAWSTGWLAGMSAAEAVLAC